MTNATRQLSHLIRLMKSGNQLYRQAQQRIPDRDLQAIFVANLRDRQKIIDALQSIAGGEAGEEGTLEEEARFLVDRADLLAVLKDNQAAVYARQLADLEAETDRAFMAAYKAEPDSEKDRHLRHLRFDFERVRDRSNAARNIAWNRESPTTLSTRLMR